MKYLSLLVLTLLLVSSSQAQAKSNAAIQQQLKSLGSEGIEVSFDAGSKVTTLRAVAENFANSETKRAGIQAMNFAAGAIYIGNGLDKSPEPILLTFWVLSGKPRFGVDHSLIVYVGDEKLDLGEARYTARARDNMEYLNFNLTREQLRKIAQESSVRFFLGQNEFNFTRSQLKLLADLYLVTEVK